MGCGASTQAPANPHATSLQAVVEEAQPSPAAPVVEEVHTAPAQPEPATPDARPQAAGSPKPPAPSGPPATEVTPLSLEPLSPEAEPQPELEPERDDRPSPTLSPRTREVARDPAPVQLVEGSRGSESEPEPESHPPQQPQQRGCEGRLVLDQSDNAPCTPAAFDPAVTPTSQTATVTLLGKGLPPSRKGTGDGRGNVKGAPLARQHSRYTNESDLSMASTSYGPSGYDSDEDELEALFTLQAWKRFYGYNRKKPQDLLTYFWRKFRPGEYSVFCLSYRHQEHLLVPYMAENVVNGFVARCEDLRLADQLFLQLYVLHDFEENAYRIVGLLLVQGQALPPALAALSAFDDFAYARADPGSLPVRHFLSALLVGRSPLNSLQLLSGRELL